DALDIVREGVSKKYAKLSNTQIRSTISGMILDVPIKAGNSVIQANTFNDGTTIASVADMNNLIFRGNIDETEVGRVKEGMPLSLTIGALSNQKFDAELEYISPKGLVESGAVLFEIKAAVKVPDSVFIRAGYSANAEIVLAHAIDAFTIPESSIEFSNDSSYVYMLKEEKPKQIFEKHPVKIGLSDGINVEVKEGLVAEDKIRGKKIEDKPKVEAKK
ncbi:MAG: HlyD family efflux transporter periplasmic adaptor subunit, partial [Dysgonamonadaceae bacterium]|nr:HlyD family efflux transporter periplasmic adaptor subunit [Dysgonamonadaceae bacterium]